MRLAKPAKFPEPPPDLADIRPDWIVIRAGYELWRIYPRAGPHPSAWNEFRAFGPVAARFDHHLPPPRPQKRGILYAAAGIVTCLAEYFQRQRTIDLVYAEPWLVGFALGADLRLLNLTGVWPTRAGASMAINSGPRPRARRWSQAIHAAYPLAQGIYYPSSMHANAPAVALYERAQPALPHRPIFHRGLADPVLLPALADAADALGYAIATRSSRSL